MVPRASRSAQLVGHQIKKVFFVKDENRDFVTRISNKMKPEKFMPGGE